jgi:hypothetical protein
MAYGDYDAPEVMVLRQFRDEVMLRLVSGRWFVNFYYAVSPRVVEILKEHDRINSIIRKMLDRVVWMVEKYYRINA